MKKLYTTLLLLAFGCVSLSTLYAQNSQESWDDYHDYIEEESYDDYADSSYNSYGWQQEFESVEIKRSNYETDQEYENDKKRRAYQDAVTTVFNVLIRNFGSGTQISLSGLNNYIQQANNNALQQSTEKILESRPFAIYGTDNEISSILPNTHNPFEFEIDLVKLQTLNHSPIKYLPDFGEHAHFKNYTGTNNSHAIYSIDPEFYIKDVYKKISEDPDFDDTSLRRDLTDPDEQAKETIKAVVEEHYKLDADNPEESDLRDSLLSSISKLVANTGLEISERQLVELENNLKAKYPLIADCILDKKYDDRAVDLVLRRQLLRNILLDVEGFEIPSYVVTCSQYLYFEDKVLNEIYNAMEFLENTHTWPSHTIKTAAFNIVAEKGISECELEFGSDVSKYPLEYTPENTEIIEPSFNTPSMDNSGKILNGVYGSNVKYYLPRTNLGQFKQLSADPFYTSRYDGNSHPLAQTSVYANGTTKKEDHDIDFPEIYLTGSTINLTNANSEVNMTINVPSKITVKSIGDHIRYVRYLKRIHWRRNIRNNQIQEVRVYGATVFDEPNTVPATYTYSTANADYGNSDWRLVHPSVSNGITFAELSGEDADYYIGSDNSLADLEKTQTINVCLGNSCTDVYNANELAERTTEYLYNKAENVSDLSLSGGLSSIATAAKRLTLPPRILNSILHFGDQYSNAELVRIIKTLNEIQDLKFRNEVITLGDREAIIARSGTIELYNYLKNEVDYSYPRNAAEWEATLMVTMNIMNLGEEGYPDPDKLEEFAALIGGLDTAVEEDLWKVAATLSEWYANYERLDTVIINTQISAIGQSLGRTLTMPISYTVSWQSSAAGLAEKLTNGLLVYNDNKDSIEDLAELLKNNPNFRVDVTGCKVVQVIGDGDKIVASAGEIGEFIAEQKCETVCNEGEILDPETCNCFIDLNDPCANKDLINKKVSSDVKEMMDSRKQNVELSPGNTVEFPSFRLQTIEHGFGENINQDRYATNITSLPDGYTPYILFEEVRRNFDSIITGGNIPLLTDVTFEPYSEEDGEIWNSTDPTGAAMDFATILDTSTVYLVDYNAEELNWTFATVRSKDHLGHFVAGFRQFGVEPTGDGSYSFYIRGADRLGGDADLKANLGDNDLLFKNAGDKTWKNVMENIENFIISRGGEVEIPFDKDGTYGTRHKYDPNGCP